MFPLRAPVRVSGTSKFRVLVVVIAGSISKQSRHSPKATETFKDYIQSSRALDPGHQGPSSSGAVR